MVEELSRSLGGKRRRFYAVAFCGCLFAASQIGAVDLSIGYRVLESTIEQQLFRDSGRYYVSGGPDDDCAYAFLEQPRLSAANGRLEMTAHLSARAGVEAFGQCVGPGDAFDVTLTGVPRVENGVLFLAEPRLVAPSRPGYGFLAPTLEGTLANSLRFDLASEVQRLTTAAARDGYRVTITGLTLSGVRLDSDSIDVEVDFSGSVTQ